MGTHCNVTAYRNAVSLQVTDTIRSYDLNFHPVPHAVTASCERYTVGFRVCYGSRKARGADGGDVSRCTSRPAQAKQGRPLGGASGAFAPGADFEGAPKRHSPTGQTLIRSTVA
jgi:hypothetical protein